VTEIEDENKMPLHIPVMMAEVLEWLDPQRDDIYVDGTLGLGGHAFQIAQAVGRSGRVIGLDRDPNALKLATEKMKKAHTQFTPVHSSSAHMRQVLDDLGITFANRILLDLGVSSMQLDKAERGFSFMREGPLDMRMDTTAGQTAADIVNTAEEAELARIFYEYGEEKFSRRIAKSIVEQRTKQPIKSTVDLASLVQGCVPRSGKIHPATRVFQALRIAVNDELATVQESLQSAWASLAIGGRLVVLSFHSLEDRLVKNAMRSWEEAGNAELVQRKVVCPGDEECRQNPRARSTKLRVCQKTEAGCGSLKRKKNKYRQ